MAPSVHVCVGEGGGEGGRGEGGRGERGGEEGEGGRRVVTKRGAKSVMAAHHTYSHTTVN